MISRGTEVVGPRQGYHYRPWPACILILAWGWGFDLARATVQEVRKHSEMLDLIPEPRAIPAPSHHAPSSFYDHLKMPT
jgi:hypothetical protein